jgi:6-phosphogluconolactonase
MTSPPTPPSPPPQPSGPEPRTPSGSAPTPPIYELAPLPAKPDLPGEVVVRDTSDDLIDAIAADLMVHAHNCVRTFGSFHLALSGGSTPVPLYRRLMYDPNYRNLPWSKTHLWIVDERRVAFHDERSNFKLINELIGDHSGIPPEQVHPIFALAPDADAEYERVLREELMWRERGQDRLDFVLLGMGSDGHTASLFPGSPALEEELRGGGEPRLVRFNEGPRVTPPDRVTMTLKLINASRLIAVMVTGEAKRPVLERVVETWRRVKGAGEVSPRAQEIEALPILGVSPASGELRWYLDLPACPPSGVGGAEGISEGRGAE